MPTFTTITLDRLIEPKASKSMAPGKNASDSRQESVVNGTKTIDKKHHWTQISPALYATPEPTPLPDTPSSFALSPYVVNHKRRGPRLSKAFSEDDVALRQPLADEKTKEMSRSLEAEDAESCRAGTDMNEDAVGQDTLKYVMLEQDSEMDDFFDPQDSLSVRSSTDGESTSNLNASVSEFYDAWEELSSESGSQPPSNDIDTELRETRLSLLLEIEKRKQAEDNLNYIQTQWSRIQEQLSLVGLNLPEDSNVDPAEDLCRQVHLIRFVSTSIGRGVAKAEIEAEMEAQLESKNFEIARLLDRLRYYEAVNHEMFQRNQETIETMRQRRQKRKRRQRWIWGSVVAAVMLGSGVLVSSYIPAGKGSSSPSRSSKA